MRETGSPAPRQAIATGREAGRPAGTRPILVVDDEPSVRAFVRDALQGAGYEVVVAADGAAALRAVYGESRAPALLLTDVEMPGMSGIELAARLGADRPGLPVVLMTGNTASARAARDREGLIEGVLLKPFTVAELFEAVGRVVGAAVPEDG